jgi:polyhydroxyalkanoate synthesis regulator phasin
MILYIISLITNKDTEIIPSLVSFGVIVTLFAINVNPEKFAIIDDDVKMWITTGIIIYFGTYIVYKNFKYFIKGAIKTAEDELEIERVIDNIAKKTHNEISYSQDLVRKQPVFSNVPVAYNQNQTANLPNNLPADSIFTKIEAAKMQLMNQEAISNLENKIDNRINNVESDMQVLREDVQSLVSRLTKLLEVVAVSMQKYKMKI